MSARNDLIRKRLRAEGEKLLALFESLTPNQWHTVIYTDGAHGSINRRPRP